jgi:hypothetical protein
VSGKLRRGLLDFALALALFWGLALAVDKDNGKAFAVPLPALAKPAPETDSFTHAPKSLASARRDWPAAVANGPEQARRQALFLLSIAFAGIAALNLAFWRHLRRAYASPRRGVWRRG